MRIYRSEKTLNSGIFYAAKELCILPEKRRRTAANTAVNKADMVTTVNS